MKIPKNIVNVISYRQKKIKLKLKKNHYFLPNKKLIFTQSFKVN